MGLFVGDIVGNAVGSAVGETVGLAVGISVGVAFAESRNREHRKAVLSVLCFYNGTAGKSLVRRH